MPGHTADSALGTAPEMLSAVYANLSSVKPHESETNSESDHPRISTQIIPEYEPETSCKGSKTATANGLVGPRTPLIHDHHYFYSNISRQMKTFVFFSKSLAHA